ncbi:hypothetical protein HZB02_07130 [Candidatus Woesearchaeota archaeon]|nr:hypothetical protein [Candidatus Woesearchaeota archaeon]
MKRLLIALFLTLAIVVAGCGEPDPILPNQKQIIGPQIKVYTLDSFTPSTTLGSFTRGTPTDYFVQPTDVQPLAQNAIVTNRWLKTRLFPFGSGIANTPSVNVVIFEFEKDMSAADQQALEQGRGCTLQQGSTIRNCITTNANGVTTRSSTFSVQRFSIWVVGSQQADIDQIMQDIRSRL